MILLIIGAHHGYLWYPHLPASASIGINYLIYMLALIVAGLSVRFSRSMMFFYAFMIILVNLTLRMEWLDDDLSRAAFAVVMPLMMIGITVLPERGLISYKAIPSYAALVVGLLTIVLLSLFSSDWTIALLLTDWVPARYFDWTGLPQSVLLVMLIALNVMLILVFMNPSLYHLEPCLTARRSYAALHPPHRDQSYR